MIKSIIELYDRGTEYYRAETKHELDMIFPVTNQKDLSLLNGNSLEEIINRIQKISSGNYDFDTRRSGTMGDSEFDERIKNVMYRANAANDRLCRSSPLALYLSHIMYYGAITEYEKIINRTNEWNVGTTYLRNMMKYEYHAMCWLMHFGDFWEGMKAKVDSDYRPRWKRESISDLMKWKELKHLVNIDGPHGSTLFENSIIFNELPCSWMKPLEFEEIEEDYLLFPRISSLAEGQSNGSYTSKMRAKEKEQYLMDYSFLRGSVPPDVQLRLISMNSDYRMNKVRQGQGF